MAGNMSNYLENKVLEHSLGVTAFTKPTNVYVALFLNDPTDAGTGTEVSASGYARKVATFGTATNGSISNNADVLFDVAGAAWGTVSYVGIYDAVSGGNLLWQGALTLAKVVAQNDQFKIASGQLTISLD